MTTLQVRSDLAAAITNACTQTGIPAPSTVDRSPGATTATLGWTPDLSAQDQATLDAIVKLAVGATLVTKAERDSIEPQLATIRLFQQQSQSEFIALAQNARDRMLFDNVTAIIRILRVFLRD